MRRSLIIAGLAAVGAVAGTQLAAATPGTGILAAPVLARATLGSDVTLISKPAEATGLEDWGGRGWKPSELPEFLKMLRDRGKVGDLGGWIAEHPGVAARMGLPAARKIPSADFAVQQVTIAPGGATGWHTHPGPAFVLVKSGEFTLYDEDDPGCTGTVFKAGQSFVDEGFGHVHIGRNTGAANLELYVVYLAPAPAGQPVRVDAAKPATSTCTF